MVQISAPSLKKGGADSLWNQYDLLVRQYQLCGKDLGSKIVSAVMVYPSGCR